MFSVKLLFTDTATTTTITTSNATSDGTFLLLLSLVDISVFRNILFSLSNNVQLAVKT